MATQPAARQFPAARVQPDDNPFSVRLRKYLTGTHLLLATTRAEVAPTPRRQVWQRGPVRLWRYQQTGRADTPAGHTPAPHHADVPPAHIPAPHHAVPVLIVYAMILRPYILDLVEGRSVVGALLDAGHDVWLVDWGDPGPEHSGMGLDAYIDDHLAAAVASVREATGSDAVTLLGHCQGGTFSAIYAALHPDEVRNLVLLAAPIDFAPRPPHAVGSWSLWSRQRWYDPRAVIGPTGNVPADLPWRLVRSMSAPFAMTLPWVDTLRHRMTTSEEGRTWLAVCQWVDEGPPISGTSFVQWLTGCYQRNDLVNGRMRVGDRPVRLGDVSASVLRVSGRRDIVTPPHQTIRADHVPAARELSTIAPTAGHVGMIVGPTAREQLYRPLTRWLSSRSS